ncbi:MAG: protease HtpX [Gammaproteobacteria bacterium HGW-Gammaproteobacteria-14]|nr:MAG: protease HtpX [Gammaproteobacteria bacterium HGW-Gammaproteobacteria-14]
MMRIVLFLLTNLAILVVGGIVLSLLGFTGFLDADGIGLDMGALFVFALVFGFTGSIISLLISKPMAKRAARVRIIDQPRNQTEIWLMQTVQELARKAKIGMPEVGIFPAQQANAFATGWNRNNALVAVSEGMLQRFTADEVKAVMAHEIGHVANGDMVTLSLVQGVVNTFVIFLARLIGFFVDRVVLKNERGLGPGYYITSIVMDIVLGFLAMTIVAWFSRVREYRADAAGAQLADRRGMIGALQRLKAEYEVPNQMPDSMVAFGINGGGLNGLKKLFASHPPLDDRIAALTEQRHG